MERRASVPCLRPAPGRAAATGRSARSASTATRSRRAARSGASAADRAGSATAPARPTRVPASRRLPPPRVRRPTFRCTYATGCAPRELMCMTLEVGGPGTWVCVRGCGPCDAGVDGALDGGVDAVADAARDAIAEGGGDGGSGIPCGMGLTCFGTDICVTSNLCGGPVNCQDVPDGGQCPAGSTLYPECQGGRPGCIPDCPGPSYRCEPRPATCGAALTCSCLPASVCPAITCAGAQGRAVLCANS